MLLPYSLIASTVSLLTGSPSILPPELLPACPPWAEGLTCYLVPESTTGSTAADKKVSAMAENLQKVNQNQSLFLFNLLTILIKGSQERDFETIDQFWAKGSEWESWLSQRTSFRRIQHLGNTSSCRQGSNMFTFSLSTYQLFLGLRLYENWRAQDAVWGLRKWWGGWQRRAGRQPPGS